jgi:phosphatidylserine/phosphatidylglycerophosphate/cardiolipin synthase-like enzyme
VHSKLIIADDKYISVGSANISDRSLMYDDEVNITVKAENKEKIRQVLSAHLRNYINTPINKIYTMFKEKRSLFEIAQIKESKLKTLKAKGRTGRYFKFVAELANPKGFSRVYKYLFNMIKKTARLIKGFFKK